MIKRRTVVTAMTFANATMNDKPATPVNSAIWINGHVPCSATPSPFQPKPEKIQPRSHSCVTHAAARRKASRKLFVDFVHGDRGEGVMLRACANIRSHFVELDPLFFSRGWTKPQNHAQSAK